MSLQNLLAVPNTYGNQWRGEGTLDKSEQSRWLCASRRRMEICLQMAREIETHPAAFDHQRTPFLFQKEALSWCPVDFGEY